MTSNKPTQEMADWLHNIGNGADPNNTLIGLCGNFIVEFGVDPTTYNINFLEWPEYSGDPLYPVGGKAEYFRAEGNKYANLYTGPWGLKRRRLALWCAEQLEKQL
jgi:hypothetical protein